MKGVVRNGEELVLPAGFRFHPTDEELVRHYLCPKCAGRPISPSIIPEIDLYKFDPWHLPEMGAKGEKEWYFFSPRDRKYPNGSRPNRAAGSGYWKATGADKPVGKPKTLGIKKALVFYAGKGIKTNWIMHEYRLANVDRSPNTTNNNLRLDDWVLCRIYNKKGRVLDNKEYVNANVRNLGEVEQETKPNILTFSQSINQVITAAPAPMPRLMPSTDYLHLEKSRDQFRMQTTNSSSCSDVHNVLSSEIQSAPKWDDFQLNVLDADDAFFGPQHYCSTHHFNPLHDTTLTNILQNYFIG